MNLNQEDIVVGSQSANEFERLYIDLRHHEKRIYTDQEVAWLPEISEDHIHRKEWDIRRASCKRLIRYLSRKNRSLKILEVGCGNGWLSYQMSQIPYSNVIGLDINLEELRQAERVFAAVPNLSFLYGGLSLVELEKFDIVVFAASIQYFNSLTDILETVLDLLNEKGEIHIIDTRFYSQEEVTEAEQRSREYFNDKGFERMYDFYFHHSLNELKRFNYSILFDPRSPLNRILRNRNPFHWIYIRK
jgi:SAM-dependent methyltransferase